MISIVIPLYNKEQAIIGTLESVKAQTFTDYECIIVNDGSTDHSAQVVEQWLYDNPHYALRFTLYTKPNGGVCSARNKGIKEAHGAYIALLDGDDLWDKNFLAEIAKMQPDFPEAYMWGINYAEVVNGNQLIRKLDTGLSDGYRGYVDNYFELAHQGRVSDLFCSSSVVIRKEVFDEVGYFDERIKYAEDTDMWWRIIARHRVAFYDRYMCFYQFDAENRALKKQIPLDKYLPYYVSKYIEFKDSPSMYRFAMYWAANRLKPYLVNSATRKMAFEAGRKIDVSVTPFKYRIIYRWPRPIAYVVFILTERIKMYKHAK